jgi:hypothetical protein
MSIASAARLRASLLRPSNISVPSYRPRPQDGSTGSVRQFVSGSGEGQPTVTLRDYRYIYQSQSECPINAQGSGRNAYALLRIHRRRAPSLRECSLQAEPVHGQ